MKLKIAVLSMAMMGMAAMGQAAWEKLPSDFPAVNAKVSHVVYISSYNDGANTRTPGAEMTISSYPARLFEIVITSGGANAQLEIIDASRSTSTLTNARRIISLDCTDAAGAQFPIAIPLNVVASSGIMINNGGDVPCKFATIWSYP